FRPGVRGGDRHQRTAGGRAGNRQQLPLWGRLVLPGENVRPLRAGRPARCRRLPGGGRGRVGGRAMCLLVFARHSHPHYPLVVVANRDELHARPARIAGWWPEHPAVLAGRDLQAGGTWMGVNLAGCWGAVTNYRDGVREPALRSRGELVTDFLSAEQEPRAYLDAVARRGGDYGGFSLLVGDLVNLYCYSNRATGIQQVSSGIHTLSNHLLDTPWPKAELARLKLGRALRKSTLALEDLLAVLADAEPFADHELPATGVGIE